MKLLYISKASRVAAHREKVAALARRVDTTLVVPERWGAQPDEPPLANDPRTVTLPTVFHGHNHFHLYRGLERVLEAIRARIEALRSDSEDEYRRLLYVAVTRAADRLVICGTEKQVGDRDKPKRWHNVISAALAAEFVSIDEGDGRVALEWRPPTGVVAKAKGKQEAMAFAPQRPPWLAQAAPPAPVGRPVPGSRRECFWPG